MLENSPHVSGLSGSAPPGMTRAALELLLFDAFPRDIAEALLTLARPAIRVGPQPLREDAPITCSRLGGLPAVTGDWAWPLEVPEKPLLFLGQINLADITDLNPARRLVPPTGLFSFFAGGDLVNGSEPSSNSGAHYYFWAEHAFHLAELPAEGFEVLPACGLAFNEAIDLPDPFSAAIENLALDKPLRDRYWDVRELVSKYGVEVARYDTIDRSKLFGWPDLVQDDLEAFSDERAVDESLLLQLGNYHDDKRRWSWGSGGLVYFTISEAALYKGDLGKGHCEMQCT